MKTILSSLAGLALLCWALGCGTAPQMNYDAVDLVKVSGRVTLDGNPLPDAIIKFESPDGQFSFGKTDADGEYSLKFDSEKSGVTPGEKTVRISTAGSLGEGMELDEAPPGEASEESESAAPEKTELVPEKYNTASEIKVTVQPDGQQTFNFDLESQ